MNSELSDQNGSHSQPTRQPEKSRKGLKLQLAMARLSDPNIIPRGTTYKNHKDLDGMMSKISMGVARTIDSQRKKVVLSNLLDVKELPHEEDPRSGQNSKKSNGGKPRSAVKFEEDNDKGYNALPEEHTRSASKVKKETRNEKE